MKLKDRKQVMRDFFRARMTKENNVINANKFFIINSIINYIYDAEEEKERMELLVVYGDLISKYLKNEVDLRWEDGRIVVDEAQHQ